MKKRSDNTLDSEATKTSAAKPEATTSKLESAKIIEEKTASSALESNSKKSVKPKTEATAAAAATAETIKPQKGNAEVKAPVSEPAKKIVGPESAKTIAVKKAANKLDPDSIKIMEAKHHDPFSILGRHSKNNQILIKVYLPYAETVRLSNNGPVLNRITGTDFFEYYAKEGELPEHYKLSWIDKNGYTHENYDPYDFGPQLPAFGAQTENKTPSIPSTVCR